MITPSNDLDELAGVLQDINICGFHVEKLIDSSTSEVRRAIQCFFKDKQSEDFLVLYISCHGIKDMEGKLFFAAKDTEIDFLDSTGVPAEFVNKIINRCRSKIQVVLLDCCHSGAFLKDMTAKSVKNADVLDEFRIEREKNNSLVNQGIGRVIITSSNSMQYSFQGCEVIGDPVTSIFTGKLVHGLKTGEADLNNDGFIDVDELYAYVYDNVIRERPEQTPQKTCIGAMGNPIVIARVHSENVERCLTSGDLLTRATQVFRESNNILQDMIRYKTQQDPEMLNDLFFSFVHSVLKGLYEVVNLGKEDRQKIRTSLMFVSENDEMYFYDAIGDYSRETVEYRPLLSEWAAGVAIRTNDKINIPDIVNDRLWSPFEKETNYSSLLIVPFRDNEDAIGVINIDSSVTDAFGEVESSLAEYASSLIETGLQSYKDKLAQSDSLLYNVDKEGRL